MGVLAYLVTAIATLVGLIRSARQRGPTGDVPSNPLERFGRAVDELARAGTPASPGCLMILAFPAFALVDAAILWLGSRVAVPILGLLGVSTDSLAIALVGLVALLTISGLTLVGGPYWVLRNAESGYPRVAPIVVLTAIFVTDAIIIGLILALQPS